MFIIERPHPTGPTNPTVESSKDLCIVTVSRTVVGLSTVHGRAPSTTPTEMGAAPPLPSFGDLSSPVLGPPVYNGGPNTAVSSVIVRVVVTPGD